MEKTLEILELNKIKDLILNYNINSLSRKKVLELKPLYFDEVVQEQLDQTKEGNKLVTLGTFPSLGSANDLSSYLDCIAKNSVISLEEIYDFVYNLELCSSLKQFIVKSKLDDKEFFYTHKYIDSLYTLNVLYDQIKYCVTPNFQLYDHASVKLKAIRSDIRKLEAEIKDKLNGYLRNNSNMLSDNYIATRGTHLVLPVKVEYKNQIKGLILDVSNSSNTVFIEPYSVTEANIKLEQLKYDEEVEIQRIIKSLCLLINRHNSELLCNNSCIEELSFMILKGNYGINNNYEIATLNEENHVEIIGAKHPLINKENVIANDFYLGGKDNNIIVISGPNAGGKTVALKTIGIIVLMNQCGLPLPVKSANLPVFRNIFVDIGDEQSIEQSLSGFTSNMKNITNIVNQVDSHSLVILDELGSKTDPSEGEALAKAIIDYLANKKAIAMVTTHYVGIKDYAKESSNITLASMGFDEDTLNPTYKLLINVIGRSYALEISERLGLKKEIIEKARSYKSEKQLNMDVVIDELSNKLQKENIILENIKEKEALLNIKLDEINNEKERLNAEYNKALEEVNSKKEQMLEEAYKEVNEIVEEFKRENDEQGFKHHLKNKAIDKLNKLSPNNKVFEDEVEEIKVGDTVKIKSIGKVCEVKEIKGSKVMLQAGNTSMQVPITDLVKINAIKPSKVAKRQVRVQEVDAISKNVPLSLNLIGMHVDEATNALKFYIDACVLVRYQTCTIIHGFGTGALRKAVHEFLKNSPYVEKFELGGYGQGGAGATLVTFKRK